MHGQGGGGGSARVGVRVGGKMRTGRGGERCMGRGRERERCMESGRAGAGEGQRSAWSGRRERCMEWRGGEVHGVGGEGEVHVVGNGEVHGARAGEVHGEGRVNGRSPSIAEIEWCVCAISSTGTRYLETLARGN